MTGVATVGGRRVEFDVSGPVTPGAPVLVFHHGQPGAALIGDDLAAAAAADVTAVLDHLGAGEFVTAGWSGGGPHALACGALLAPRCRAVATIAGVAPYHGVDDLDWTAGMGPENVAEFSALIAGDPAVEGQIAGLCAALESVADGEVADLLGGLISPPDRAALEGGAGALMGAWLRRSATTGHHGYLDDGRAFVGPWGFDPTLISVPVQVWMADLDLMVPPSHGRWLASRLPTATAILMEGEGHISLGVTHLGAIVDRLVAAGGLSGGAPPG